MENRIKDPYQVACGRGVRPVLHPNTSFSKRMIGQTGFLAGHHEVKITGQSPLELLARNNGIDQTVIAQKAQLFENPVATPPWWCP